MLKSLRKRFIGINMAIVAGMLLIIFGLVFHFTKVDLENKSNTMLQIISQGVKEPGSQNRDVFLPYFILDINTRGEILISGNSHYDLSDSSFIHELLQVVNDAQKQVGRIPKYDLKYRLSSGPTGSRIVFLDVSSNTDALSSLLQTSIVIGTLAIAAFTFISILLARWAVKPVEHAWTQQKQFVSDASHELKTPLTVIISNAELLQNDQTQDDQRLQYSNNILSSSQQMRHLVEGLLDLARADNGNIQSNFTVVDLSRTISDSVLTFDAIFFENNLTLNSNILPQILVQGSAQHLRQLIDILLDNAQKYSSPGIVDVELYRYNKNQCMLTVSNPGAPIPTNELEKIFQRFYRADTARSNTGSFGLGLSIAQRIANEHNGQIWAESNTTGNRFCVLLPCLSE